VAIWDVPARLWALIRKVEDLLEQQRKSRVALENIDTRLRALEDRITHLEAHQGQVITEARAATGLIVFAVANVARW